MSSLDRYADTHSTRGIITEFNHTLYYIKVLKRVFITIIWPKAISIKITAEALKVNESIQLHGKLSVEQRPIAPLILVGEVCNMRRCSRVGQHLEYAGK